MIEALLGLAAFAVLLNVVLFVEIALFLRVRQGDFEEMLIAIEAEARATRHTLRALTGSVDASLLADRLELRERARQDGH